MTPIQTELLRAFLVGLLTIVSGCAVYDSPPESLAVFMSWMWQPSQQAAEVALGSLLTGMGLHSAVKHKRNKPTGNK